MKDVPLVSIIVPIYNVELYLDKCIESICNQTYKNMQIILVNDGSNDESKIIMELWKEKDSRIELIEQENKGLVNARKTGILEAKGDYSIYVDGDDWIEYKLVETLVKACMNEKVDIVCAGHIIDYGSDIKIVHNTIGDGIYCVRDIVSHMLYKDEFYNFGITQYAWSKMFRTEIIRKNQLKVPDEISIGEDVAIVYNSILSASKINIIGYAGYHYIQRNNSMCNVFQKNEERQCTILIDYLKNCFEKDGRKDILINQLQQYSKLLYLCRAIQVFDKNSVDKILTPFGGIERKCRIILYGAGILGKSVKAYLNFCSEVSVVAWVDGNYQRYKEGNIKSPETYDYEAKIVDYIVICVSDARNIRSIRQYLETRMKGKSKILSLTNEFLKKKIL